LPYDGIGPGPGEPLSHLLLFMLMVQWVPEIKRAGGSSYTFHYEACSRFYPPDQVLTIGSPSDVMHVLDLIQTHKMKSGLAISPNTPASSITDEMGNKADLLLVMTVHPGRGGQKFMPECLKKVEELRSRFPGKNIQVDGGVGSGNACQCAQAGTFFTTLDVNVG
jgi:ribulose-phosphate 3-epimerase